MVGAARGAGFTVTVVVYIVVGEQPEPGPLFTVSEYVVVTVGVAVGFCAVVDDRLGPLHVKPVVLPPGFANNVAVPPLHIGPLFVGAATGNR